MLKRILVSFNVFAAVLFLSCTSSQDVAKKKPVAALDKISIVSVSLKEITLKADVLITNPYPLSIEISKSIAETMVEGRRLSYTSSNGGFYVNAGKTEKASFDITVKYEDLEKAVANYAQKEEIALTINLVFDIVLPDLPFLPKTTMLSFSIDKTLPALKPEFSLKNVGIIVPPKADIAKALMKAKKSPVALVRLLGLFSGLSDEGAAKDLSGIDLYFGITFDAVMENKTKSKIEFRRLVYMMTMNDVEIGGGISTEIKNEGSKSTMHVVNTLNSKSVHHALLMGLVTGGKNIKLKGIADAKFPDQISKEPVVFKFGE
jgi:LEA14-like dessication related protein